jgi:spore germination protein YaaH
MRALPALLALLAATTAHAAPAALAYYESAASLPSLKAEATTLNTVAADVYAVSATGKVTGRIPAALASIATTNHIAVLATVSNYATAGFSAKIATAILTPGAAQTAALAGILRVAKTTAGINIDFEAIPHKERALYTAFTQTLATRLHAANKLLVLSVPAETADNPNDSWSGAYDFAALGAFADTLQVMTYDENGPWGPPGPVAGLDWVTACLTFAESVVPAAKISLGMPAYGYDWNTTKGTGITVNWNQIPALLSQTGATPQWDAATSSPWFAYTDAKGNAHTVWYENAQSITLKAALAAQKSAASISVWALGLDNAAYWQAIEAGFAAAP